MFVMSFEGIGLAIITPIGWIPMAVFIAVALAAQRRAESEDATVPVSRTRWLAELALLLVIPLGLVIAAEILSESPRAGTRAISPVEIAVMSVLALQALLAAALIWRHRHRWLSTALTAGGILLWSAGASVIAAMAITDNWL